MTNVITLPTYMSLRDWADQIVLDLDPYGRIGNLQDDTKWQDWACRLLIIRLYLKPFQFHTISMIGGTGLKDFVRCWHDACYWI